MGPVTPGMHGHNLTQAASRDLVLQNRILSLKPEYLANHEDTLCRGGSGDHFFALTKIECERLLYKNVFAIGQRTGHGTGVHILRRDHVNGIQPGPIANLLE